MLFNNLKKNAIYKLAFSRYKIQNKHKIDSLASFMVKTKGNILKNMQLSSVE